MVILARMGLSFWKTEEEWSMEWIRTGNPTCIGGNGFEKRIREMLSRGLHESITDLPPNQTAASSSRVAPPEQS